MNLNEEAAMPQPDNEGQALQSDGGAPKEIPANGDEQQVDTAEIQDQMDIFISNGMMILHNQKVSDGILSKILKNKHKMKAMAEAMVGIVNRLAISAEKSGQKLANETIAFGTNYLLGELIEVAEAAGMQKLSTEQKTEILQRCIGMYISEAVDSGRMTKAELKKLGEQAASTQEGQAIITQGNKVEV